ncbi:MAG TPA: methyltransferase domain-containing protein [Candidatus Lokiarchaeia archaeon]
MHHFITSKHIFLTPKVIIDIGCGKGNIIKSLFNINNLMLTHSYSIGLDIFIPSLLTARKIYDDVVRCDVKCLPLRDASGDIVLATQILEHLKKNDGFDLIRDIEKISREIIIISLPVGDNPKQHLEDDNLWQAHLSSWHPDEFKAMGFKVYGYEGARFFRSERGSFKMKSKIILPYLFILSLFTQLFTYRLVTVSYQMVCIKIKKNYGL